MKRGSLLCKNDMLLLLHQISQGFLRSNPGFLTLMELPSWDCVKANYIKWDYDTMTGPIKSAKYKKFQ